MFIKQHSKLTRSRHSTTRRASWWLCCALVTANIVQTHRNHGKTQPMLERACMGLCQNQSDPPPPNAVNIISWFPKSIPPAFPRPCLETLGMWTRVVPSCLPKVEVRCGHLGWRLCKPSSSKLQRGMTQGLGMNLGIQGNHSGWFIGSIPVFNSLL